MSKAKRLKRKRAQQRKVNIHQMALKQSSSAMLGSRKLLKRMPRDHLDVLQNIEFVLITGYRDDRSIDDRIVAHALEAAINDNVPDDPRSVSLNDGLENIRELRSDISDDIWRDALRTVLQSVHRHSSRRPGARDYLDFISDLVL